MVSCYLIVAPWYNIQHHIVHFDKVTAGGHLVENMATKASIKLSQLTIVARQIYRVDEKAGCRRCSFVKTW